MFDLLIKNARVIDGSGSPWFRADVGVKGGRICFVGLAGNAEAAETVDAKDMFLAPGFIDIHSHTDQNVFGSPRGKAAYFRALRRSLWATAA